MPLVLIVVAGSSLGWASSLTCIVALVSKKLQALKQSHHQVYRQIYRQMYRQALHPLRASTVFFQVFTKPLPKYIGNFSMSPPGKPEVTEVLRKFSEALSLIFSEKRQGFVPHLFNTFITFALSTLGR